MLLFEHFASGILNDLWEARFFPKTSRTPHGRMQLKCQLNYVQLLTQIINILMVQKGRSFKLWLQPCWTEEAFWTRGKMSSRTSPKSRCSLWSALHYRDLDQKGDSNFLFKWQKTYFNISLDMWIFSTHTLSLSQGNNVVIISANGWRATLSNEPQQHLKCKEYTFFCDVCWNLPTYAETHMHFKLVAASWSAFLAFPIIWGRIIFYSSLHLLCFTFY